MVFRSFFIFYSYNLFFPFFFLLFFIMQNNFSYSRCGYCKSLNHELTILSGLLEAENIDAYIISIDATIEKKVLITHIYSRFLIIMYKSLLFDLKAGRKRRIGWLPNHKYLSTWKILIQLFRPKKIPVYIYFFPFHLLYRYTYLLINLLF